MFGLIRNIAENVGSDVIVDLERYGDRFLDLFAAHSDDLLGLYREYGSRAIEAGITYGDNLFRGIATYGDDYACLVMNYGDDVVDGIARHGDDFMERYAKSGDEFVEEFLENGDEVFEGGTQGGGGATKPTLPKGSTPRGEFTPEKNFGLIGQNNAARKLAQEGYDVEMLDEKNGGNGYGINPNANPDFLIDNKVFDCYTPGEDTSPQNIKDKIYDKTKKQSDRIVLNLENKQMKDIDELKNYLLEKTKDDLKRLKELLVILPDDTIETWFIREQ